MQYEKAPAQYYDPQRDEEKDKLVKEWYALRNASIYKDKMSGMSNTELVTKYQLSPARLQVVIKNERARHEFRRGYERNR